MKTHTDKGFQILKDSRREIVNAGAIIARDHHEKWDGSGYPKGKKGEEIHVFGRIVALADVYDALRHNRCYKPAWEISEVQAEISNQSGKHFDPKLVSIFNSIVDELEKILELYPDH